MQLLLATENPGKKEELTVLLSRLGIECVMPSEVVKATLSFPEETGRTFAENALIKAEYLHKLSGMTTLADDSGISVKALDNFPGVHSARWIQGDSSVRYNGLLKKMQGITQRDAFFTCVLCLLVPNSNPKYFEGIFEGTIATEPKGNSGFDYDYIFIPKGETKTLAELGTDYKNKHSHRAVALQKLNNYITKHMLN